MEQLKLPFMESNETRAKRVFKEMLRVTPRNPCGYTTKHMVEWLYRNPSLELYVNGGGLIVYRSRRELS